MTCRKGEIKAKMHKRKTTFRKEGKNMGEAFRKEEKKNTSFLNWVEEREEK